MQVRQGTVRDWPFMYALGKIGIPDSISPWRKQSLKVTLKYREEFLRGFWTWIQQSKSEVFIAEETEPAEGDSRQPIGYLVLHGSAQEELTGVLQGWIMDIVVKPEWRGRGAGRALLEAAEAYCRRHKIPYLGLAVSSHNLKALQLYEKFGFAEERKLLVKSLDNEE